MNTNVSFYDRIEDAIAHPDRHRPVGVGAMRFAAKRLAAAAAYPEFEAMWDRARRIRAHTLCRLDHYLGQFANQVEKNGGHVFFAADAAEANRYVTDLARKRGVKKAIKSKSMVTEEIELNHALEAAGVEPIESDLGEFIIQLAREKPSHIIAPVMHKTRQQVGELFAEKLGIPYSDDPEELNRVARSRLRTEFLTADMGITGCNFAVAESGSVALVTNEGNARLTTTTPRIHIVLMGMERIVPTFADLGVMFQILARSATGQKLSVYSTIVSGPRRAGEADGPEEFHVVILDNGRSSTLGGELAEILYCIRCGACLNSCPVYQAIGGHAYGSVYPGPVGKVVTPALMGFGPWADLPHASTLCGACREVCPVRIDIPHLLLKLREQGHEVGRTPAWLRVGLGIYRAAAERPWFFRLGLKANQVATRFLAGRDGWIDRLPPPLTGWTDHRAFPALARESFRTWWGRREEGNGERGTGNGGEGGRDGS